MFGLPPRELLYIAYRVTLTFEGPYGEQKPMAGTGFVIAASSIPVLVTNRHVIDLDYGESTPKYRDYKLKGLQLWGRTKEDRSYVLTLDPTQPFSFSSTRENDVACLVGFRGQISDPAFQIYHHVLIDDLAVARAFDDSLFPGDQVLFPGFPDQFDRSAHRPLLRGGIIASDPKYAYSNSGVFEGDRVAYEAFSSSGSSGSPVFAVPRGFGSQPGARPGMVVGVNAGHIPGAFGAHTGISYFFKSTVVLDILRAHGLEKAT